MATRDGAQPAGWLVRVTTKRLGGGEPLRTYYGARFFMSGEAEDAVKVRDGATQDEEVEAIEPLSQSTLDGLGIANGGVAPYPDQT